MADATISSLTELTGVDSAADFLPIVDTSAGATKKVKPQNVLGGLLPSGTAAAPTYVVPDAPSNVFQRLMVFPTGDNHQFSLRMGATKFNSVQDNVMSFASNVNADGTLDDTTQGSVQIQIESQYNVGGGLNTEEYHVIFNGVGSSNYSNRVFTSQLQHSATPLMIAGIFANTFTITNPNSLGSEGGGTGGSNFLTFDGNPAHASSITVPAALNIRSTTGNIVMAPTPTNAGGSGVGLYLDGETAATGSDYPLLISALTGGYRFFKLSNLSTGHIVLGAQCAPFVADEVYFTNDFGRIYWNAAGGFIFGTGGLNTTPHAFIDSAIALPLLAANPSVPTSNGAPNIYVKGTKLVIQFNSGGTAHYFTIDMATASSQSFTYSASAP